jgi:hypothetical protein
VTQKVPSLHAREDPEAKSKTNEVPGPASRKFTRTRNDSVRQSSRAGTARPDTVVRMTLIDPVPDFDDEEAPYAREHTFPDDLLVIAHAQAAMYTPAEQQLSIDALDRLHKLAHAVDPLEGVEWINGEDLFTGYRATAYRTHWNMADAAALRAIDARNQSAIADAVRLLDRLQGHSSQYGDRGPWARPSIPLGRSGLRAAVDKGWVLAYFVDHLKEDEKDGWRQHESWVLYAAHTDPCWHFNGRL